MRSAVPFGEWFELGRHAQLELLEIDVRIRRCKMEAGWNLAVLEHQHRFEKSGDAGGGFQMAEIRLDRADGQRRVGGSIDAESFRESMRFDRIAHRRARAVRFDKTNFFGRDPRILAGVPHQPRLRLRARAARCRWCVHPD